MQRAAAIACFAFGAAPNCVSMPDPPPPAEDLSALAAQYDRPRATIPFDLVERLVAEGQRYAELGQLLDRLHFIRAAVSDTSAGIQRTGNIEDFILQGSITATVTCPGDESAPPTDAGSNGVLRLQLGLEDSRLRRGFSGRAEQCRLLVRARSAPDQRVVVSAGVVGDLGADLGIENANLTDVLIKLTNVTGSATSALGTALLSAPEYHFRMTRSDAFEVLFDPASLGLPDVGTVVFVLRADGSYALRESRGEWTCGGGSQPCALR
jgi:hypothetical protein